MNLKRFIKAGVGYIIGGILIKGIAFITTPIFTRLLTTSEFGILNTYLSYEAIFAMVIGFQFAASLKSARLEYEDVENGVGSYLYSLLFLISIHTIVIILALNLLFPIASNITGISSRLLINLLVINSFCNALVNVYNAYISLYYEYKKYVGIGLINAVANVGISLLLIHTVMNNNRAIARIMGYIIPYVGVSLYIIIQIVKRKSKSKIQSVQFAYRYCTPLIPYACSDVMLGQFSKLYVERKCGSSLMGIYSLSYNVYSIIGIIRIAMDYLIGPLYFEKRKESNINGIRSLIKHYSRILGLISVSLMLFAPEVIKILGAPEYYDARYSAIPLVAASYYIFLISTVTQEEYFQKKTYMISAVSIVAMTANILANILIVPQYGVIGAAFCTMGTYYIMLLSHFIVVRKVLNSNIFDIRILLLHTLIVLTAAIISLLVTDIAILRFGLLIIVIIFLAVEALNANKQFQIVKIQAKG